MTEPKIIYNAIRTPDGTLLHSRSVHDYLSYTDSNGETYSNDGGNEYLRRNINTVPATDLTVYSNGSHEEIREVFLWGTYGKKPDINDPDFGYTWVKLKDLSTPHIRAIIKTQTQMSPWRKQIFEDELLWREVNDIFIEEIEDYSLIVKDYE